MKIKAGWFALAILMTSTWLVAETNQSYAGLAPHDRHTFGINLPGMEVNTFNGNLLMWEFLFLMPGKGLPFESYLMHNSDHRQVSSSFGKGWTFSYHVRYQRHGNGDITIVWGSGRQDRFAAVPGPGSGFAPPAGLAMELTEPTPGQIQLKTKYGILFHFANALHRKLTRVVDPNQNAITLSYVAYSRLRFMTDASGRQIELVYNSRDLVHRINDLTGNRTYKLVFDDQDCLTQVIDPLGNAKTYTYDEDYLITGVTDKRGHTAILNYLTPAHDAGTRLPQSIAKDIATTSFLFDRDNRDVSVNDARGETWEVTYDAMGRLGALSDPLGKTSQYTWDSAYNLTSLTNRNGETHHFTYDALGNQLSHQDPLGFMRSWTYDPAYNRRATYVDAKANTWFYNYDPKGNLLQITNPLGQATQIAYDAFGQPTQSTNAEMHTTLYSFDMYGNMHTITDPLGHVRTHTYDALSREVETEDANGHRTTFQYDALNRKTTRTDHLGLVYSAVFDADGYRTRVTEPRGAITRYFYDALGRRTAVENSLGQMKTFSHDAMGNLVSATDERGNTTQFTYDETGRLATKTTALGNTWTYGYDCEGNQTSRLDPEGQTITRTFDALGRLVTRTLPGPMTTTYNYDANSNLLSASQPGSTIARTYDELNRRVTETDVDLGKTLTTTYYPDGLLHTMVRPDGDTQSNTYDMGNRLSRITADGSQFDYAYDAAGRRTQIVRSGMVTTDYAYDAINRMTYQETSDTSASMSQAFMYTENQLIETRDDGTTNTNTFDLLSRLTRDVRTGTPSYDFNYSYDASGNMTGNSGTTPFFPTDPLTLTYDADNQILTEMGTDFGGAYLRTFTYDGNGNLTEKLGVGISSVVFTYDALNRVLSAADSVVGSESYTYDALDRLRTIEVAAPAPGELAYQRFFYDPDNRIILNYDMAGNLQEQYWHNRGNLSAILGAVDQDSDDSDEILVTTDFFANARQEIEQRNRARVWKWGLPPVLPPLPDEIPEVNPNRFRPDADGSEGDEFVNILPFLAQPHYGRGALPLEPKPPKGGLLFDYPGHLGNIVVPTPPTDPRYGFPRYPDDYLIRKMNTTRYYLIQDAYGNICGELLGPLSGLLKQFYDLLGRILLYGNPGPISSGGQMFYRGRLNSTVGVRGRVFENYTTFLANQPGDSRTAFRNRTRDGDELLWNSRVRRPKRLGRLR